MNTIKKAFIRELKQIFDKDKSVNLHVKLTEKVLIYFDKMQIRHHWDQRYNSNLNSSMISILNNKSDDLYHDCWRLEIGGGLIFRSQEGKGVENMGTDSLYLLTKMQEKISSYQMDLCFSCVQMTNRIS